MKNAIIIFLVFALIGFGGGYLVSQTMKGTDDVAAPTPAETEEANNAGNEPATNESEGSNSGGATAVSAEGEIISQKGCLACHSVEKLGLTGGTTGPDLSQAYANVQDKHGKPINEFLKEPTTAVMSSVMGGNPLTDDEINQIVEALKIASEK
ncbi:c-type cytochrome [Calidifontibacillus erzurumensis]|uniref:C-type cytochrome n=1 Tax=Calidifontibacillus erzurumensis TaxID=2741433 RepID=A0A8J8K889_9BACI|nr:c-type cytochrome [Calidifontibacillus erzurumensis]NSL51636.1 c-type cytochrome [Calidifontibacillus erzurumensis]